ncbi:MAG: DUF1223 domain-containing protein [Pseudomonadota bacterium]
MTQDSRKRSTAPARVPQPASRRLLGALAIGLGLAAPLPAAAEGPVLVELFTSQGCSSCPPADRLLGELTERDGVLALSFHVDYWDYLGWRDTFADSRYTKRQIDYRDAWGARVVYTPQMVVGGQEGVVGSRSGEVKNAVEKMAAAAKPGRIEIQRKDGGLIAKLADLEPSSEVHIAVFDREAAVAIARGENAGREITYHNVVRDFIRIGTAAGVGRSVMVPEPGEGQGVAIWAQADEAGPVEATAYYLAGAPLATAQAE